MPLVNVYTSAAPPAAPQAFLLRLSVTLSRELGKPEAYVMTCLMPRVAMTFAGTDQPSCYAEIKNIGHFSAEVTARLSRLVSDLLSEGLGVPPNRIYLEFQDAKPELWGFDGETFA